MQELQNCKLYLKQVIQSIVGGDTLSDFTQREHSEKYLNFFVDLVKNISDLRKCVGEKGCCI